MEAIDIKNALADIAHAARPPSWGKTSQKLGWTAVLPAAGRASQHRKINLGLCELESTEACKHDLRQAHLLLDPFLVAGDVGCHSLVIPAAGAGGLV